MKGSEGVFDLLRDWLAVSNPGLVTRDDLARLESRIDELFELVDELEAELEPHLAPTDPEP